MRLTGEFISLFFEAASIQRWNDHIRPSQGFTELDKQAHKMLFAYVLGKFEEDVHNCTLNWIGLIDGALYELLHRIKLTDIKPPVFHRLMSEEGPALNEWVIKQLNQQIADSTLLKEMERYFETEKTKEKKLLSAAHYLATQWEFRTIYHLNQGFYGLESTREAIENQLEDHSDLVGVQRLALKRKAYRFMDLVGQLRFQQRWAQSPRVPETSVLGHMLIVAFMAYLSSPKKEDVESFFRGLFHDLPEALTRDIVSPVKKSIPDLEEHITRIEHEEMDNVLLPLVPESWRETLRHYTRPLKDSRIKACDDLAAFVEASLSIRHGITSQHLETARCKLFNEYSEKADHPFEAAFQYFWDLSK